MADEIQKAVGDYLLSRINATHDAIMTDANPDYLPRTPDDPSLLSHRELVERVERVKEFCKQMIETNNPMPRFIMERILKILECGK